MNIPDRFIDVLAAEVGVREEGGNNKGPRVLEYQRATWMPEAACLAGFPWCAALLAFGLRGALIREGVAPKIADAWRCKDASAIGWIGWGQRAPGCLVLPPDTKELLRGDIVVFDFNGPTAAGGGHIAAIERDVPGDTFHTIEGNTNDAGARDSLTGDGVLRKTRGSRTVVNFIRLPTQLA